MSRLLATLILDDRVLWRLHSDGWRLFTGERDAVLDALHPLTQDERPSGVATVEKLVDVLRSKPSTKDVVVVWNRTPEPA